MLLNLKCTHLRWEAILLGWLVGVMCWVNFKCWGVLLIWIIVGQGPTVLAVGVGMGCFSHLSFLSLFPSLWETA